MANAEVFDSFFRRADLDKDGRISGQEAVGFFQGAGLPQMTLAKVRPFLSPLLRECMSDRPFPRGPPLQGSRSIVVVVVEMLTAVARP